MGVGTITDAGGGPWSRVRPLGAAEGTRGGVTTSVRLAVRAIVQRGLSTFWAGCVPRDGTTRWASTPGVHGGASSGSVWPSLCGAKINKIPQNGALRVYSPHTSEAEADPTAPQAASRPLPTLVRGGRTEERFVCTHPTHLRLQLTPLRHRPHRGHCQLW